MSDNWLFDVMAEDDAALRHALALAFLHHGTATHYDVIDHASESNGWTAGGRPVATLVLYWTKPEKAHALPFPLEIESAPAFVANWLKHVTYPNQPDHDGDNGKGFRVFCEAWGHVAGRWEAMLGVQPCWMMYGK